MIGTTKHRKNGSLLYISPSQRTTTHSLKKHHSRGDRSSLNKYQSTNDYDPSIKTTTAGGGGGGGGIQANHHLFPSTTNFTNMLKQRPTTTHGLRAKAYRGVTFENDQQDALTMAISSQMTVMTPQNTQGFIQSGAHTMQHRRIKSSLNNYRANALTQLNNPPSIKSQHHNNSSKLSNFRNRATHGATSSVPRMSSVMQ